MATVIDALVVTLGLDPSKYKAGSAEAQKSLKVTRDEAALTARSMSAEGERAAQFFVKIRNEALGVLAIFTAGVGIKDFVSNVVGGAAALGRLSSDLGVSTRDLSAWQRAAEMAGGSAEGIVAQLKQSQSAVASWKLGQVTGDEQAFFQYGGKAEDLADGNQYLLARSKIVADMFKVDPGRAQLIAQQMGLDPAQFDFLKQGPSLIQQQVGAMKAHSSVTAENAARADELRKKWLEFTYTLSDTGTTIALALMPALDRILVWAERLAVWVEKHKSDIALWVDNTAKAIGRFADRADEAAKSVGGWKNVLLALGAIKLLSVTNNLLGLTGALLGVGRALGLISRVGVGAGAALSTALKAAPAAEAAVLGTAAVGIGLGALAKGTVAGGDDWKSGFDAARNDPIKGGLWGHMKDDWSKWTTPNPDANGAAQLAAHNPKAQAAVKYLMTKGLPRSQASGIAANWYVETGGTFDPHARGDGGAAYGLGQWHEDRQQQFYEHFGHPITSSTAAEQMDFAVWEYTQGREQAGGAKFNAAADPAAAGAAYSRFIERPGIDKYHQDREASTRAAYAAEIARVSAQDGVPDQAGADVTSPPAGAPSPASTNTSTTEVTTGDIHIHTPSTDPQRHAQVFNDSLQREIFGSNANSGVN